MDAPTERGLLDTNLVIQLSHVDPHDLPSLCEKTIDQRTADESRCSCHKCPHSANLAP